MSDNLFRAAADLYDLDPRPIVMDDVAFYLERAEMYPGNLLELACGTGRVMIPLAKAGYRVWGVDLSRNMLARFEKKLMELPADIGEKITFIHSDMCDFDLNREFSMIYIPFRSFQALTSETQQKACLERVKKHLAADGRFIINVFKPYAVLDESWVQHEKLNWEAIDPRTGYTVKMTDLRKRIDVKDQIIYPDLIYYVTDDPGTVTRIVEPLSLKYYYEDQIKYLLVSNGFIIEEEMGYYDGRPVKDGGELIFICRKA